ncbi:hypothetical protein BG011_000207 [Mortierella polycephala]|uniref:Ser-Thr-rich glycosyl-phosphatidyl-inositol-anchored membrane family-domain-containing protein n=1 Tax=Mortierella polycephala TaxID=41804 RepID=A0A9P6U705_9FUNG|nr:hypothetical protein BG011_000207 [Mortierella polycephala]
MRFYAAVLAAMLLVNSSVFAQQVNITYPRQWKSGVTANASWTFNPPPPTTGLSIDLFSWSAPTQDVFAHLGVSEPWATSLEVDVPRGLHTDWYAIRVGDTYSPYFQITGRGPYRYGPPPEFPTFVTPSGLRPTATATGTATMTTMTNSTITPLPPTNAAVGPLMIEGAVSYLAAALAIIVTVGVVL